MISIHMLDDEVFGRHGDCAGWRKRLGRGEDAIGELKHDWDDSKKST